jgi:Cu+-exporting ATPase
MKKLELKLHDVECSNCAIQIEDALENVRGVSRAEVNVRRETVAVEADDTVHSGELIDRLEEIGFPASPIEPPNG